jgi:hypothetical protein
MRVYWVRIIVGRMVLFGIFLTADAVSGFKDKSILTLPVLLNY